MEQPNVIVVTRLNGPALAINADLIQRAEATPDTVVTLVDGTQVVVAETVEQLVERMGEHRASVLVRAAEMERGTRTPGAPPTLRVVPTDGGRH